MTSPTGADALSHAPTRRGRLFRKYLVIFVVVVSGALLTSGLVEAYFVYQENEAAVIRLQRERATAAASRIEQFLRETQHLLGWVVLPPPSGAPVLAQRQHDFERLLSLAPFVQDLIRSMPRAPSSSEFRVEVRIACQVGSIIPSSPGCSTPGPETWRSAR